MKISFAHNVQNRIRTLRETIEIERKFFPDAPIYVAYNDKTLHLRYFEDLKNITFTYYNGEGHKIGCVNGCITSIKDTLQDDNDIVVFSHDDVRINQNYIDVFTSNVKKILEGENDVICRKPDTYGDKYLMMEGFFLKKEAAIKIFENQKLYKKNIELPKDIKKSPSPEVWLYNVINKAMVNSSIITYKHQLKDYNKTLGEVLGFHHKNAGKRGWHD